MAKALKTSRAAAGQFQAQPVAASPRRSFWMFWILSVGFVLRAYHLEIKPIHFDEGINGHFVQSIWRDGFYRYDPTNFHGPLYFYVLALAERIFGFGIFGFRFVNGLINLAAIFVVGLHRRFFGRAAIYAALILAVSPAFVFYSRYAIHESLFVFSEVAFSYGYFLYQREKSNASLWWMAFAVVGLATTKETFFVFLGTWVIAVGAVRCFEFGFGRLSSGPPTDSEIGVSVGVGVGLSDSNEILVQNWIAVSMVALVLILALFTGFFLYLPGAIDMLRALAVWTQTGTAHTGHEKPFTYWIMLLSQYEWPCLIGLCLSPVLFFFVNRSLRIVLMFGFGTWLAYSLIPYKTPWLILNLQWPLAIAAGAVIARVWPSFVWRGARSGLAVLTFASIFFSAGEMWRLNFHDFAKPGHAYVYVQSTEEFKRATDIVLAHVHRVPEDVNMKVLAMNRDPWPLPYVLQPLANVAWGHSEATDLASADVIFSDNEDRASIERRLRGSYYVLPFQIRDAYQGGQAYLAADKFKDDVPAATPIVSGGLP